MLVAPTPSLCFSWLCSPLSYWGRHLLSSVGQTDLHYGGVIPCQLSGFPGVSLSFSLLKISFFFNELGTLDIVGLKQNCIPAFHYYTKHLSQANFRGLFSSQLQSLGTLCWIQLGSVRAVGTMDEWEEEQTRPDRKLESDSGLWLPLKTTVSGELSIPWCLC